MVWFQLMITADFDEILSLELQGGCDDPNYTYLFKLKCENCGEVTKKETCLSLNEEVPIIKGTTNLVQKCKLCSREGTVTMIPGKGRVLTKDLTETGKYSPLMIFDCRGYEPVDFVFGPGWKAKSVKGSKFENIDLSEGEFSEYCEKGKCGVMISNLRTYFNVVK